MAHPIEGMENVVATVSGYHGSERFKLIKLISHSGASYVGAMSRSITHLVCWEFEGKKYNLAKKFDTIIVNHQWVEECIKQGKRVPETPYMSKSGAEVGLLTIEVPAVSGEGEVTKKLKKPVEISDKFFGNCEETWGGGASDFSAWTDSILLKEKNIESNLQSRRSTRKKRNNLSEDKENTGLGECSRKGQRLTKKHSFRTIVDIESDQESDINRNEILDNQRNNGRAPRQPHSEDENDCVAVETSTRQCAGHSETTNWDLDEIEETENWSHSSLFKRPRSSHANASNELHRTHDHNGENFNKLESRKEDREATEMTNTPLASSDVSCVICWTEFSSTRGILPCGHRFCYPCIQNWADRLVSRGKDSACPLCKASFSSITKVEDAGSSDQKIYSQTVPSPSSTDNLIILPEQERPNFRALPLASACTRCYSREPQDLLIRCHICNFRCIHSYCLDPYLLPWACTHCSDMQMLYNRGY
ncbi:PREDICTED: uncharacterized protein LOC104822671 [Tarenaya hassleriana]|uniref:uncharacterized protein LOC104822671 n=1 Tax=Tarenaya hassleriana TaxID=28532 RepID=UPI00053C9734|nr:PREDICTED: uncharacterized protein LOC104822671 [Tarenaya hassleriana]XP_010552281.1 PREDICTED: uncharacterized protein LOC104822671 [Tarenaya hassleriana]XP_010552289.1 PREDICTED: uncharacterized protein LOC104822671 [Tarenaya hassleriana]